MKPVTVPVFSTCIFLLGAAVVSAGDDECRIKGDSPTAVHLFISTKRNPAGDWMTNFTLSKGDPDSGDVNNATLDLKQDVTESSGMRMVRIRGVISGLPSSEIKKAKNLEEDPLRFSNKCGSNVAVLNNGSTAQKINFEDKGNALVFSHRPLRDNELLEIILEKKNTKFGKSLAIGVTTLSPKDTAPPEHIDHIKSGSWAWYHKNVYYNGVEKLKNYAKDINSLEVGGRVGVMRSNTGSLHFYWNGVDQGPAASNVPDTVYGVIGLYADAGMVSIVAS